MSETDDTARPVRRDFLTLLTVATAGFGIAGFAWPFLDSLGRGDSADEADSAVEIDLAPLLPGQQIVVRWRAMPVFVLRRTPEAIARLSDPALAARLRDPQSREPQQPDYAEGPTRSITPEYGVMVGICTHLGCVPRLRATPEAGSGAWPGGYLCPCHGSRFDLAGRVFSGVPAQYNLPVPPHGMIGPKRLRIGAGPDGARFDFSAIRAL